MTTQSGMTRLLYADEHGSRQEILLSPNKPRLVFGRSPRADVSLTWDPEVSQLHAILEWIGHYWVVNDDNMSRNGTFVNDERLTGSRRLHQGDMIRMGTTTIGFVGTLGIDEGVTNDGSKLGALQPLTSAETRVLIAMCRPYKNKAGFGNPASNQQIADELGVGIETVKTHLRSLFAKFGVDDLPQNQKRAGLVERAMLSGTVKRSEL